MAEVVRECRWVVVAPGGRAYCARVCGAEARDGTQRWHGWIEFVNYDDGTTVRTQRETTQPNRTDTAYWAYGLTLHYLEGALRRALNPIVVPRRQSPRSRPAYEAPAAHYVASADSEDVSVTLPKPPPSVLALAGIGARDSLNAQIRRLVAIRHDHAI